MIDHLKYLACLLFFVFVANIALGQITWNFAANIAPGSFDNLHPRMVTDGSGDPVVIWGRQSDASVWFARWNGTGFTTPVQLNPPWMNVAVASWMGPDIASKGDTLYVVAKRTPEAADTNRVFIFRSFDGGITFQQPVELAVIADSISRFPTVTTDDDGNPVVAFMKFDALFGDSRWAVTKSNDFGATFVTDIKASGWGNSGAVCDCCPGAVVTSGNFTSMLYRDNNQNPYGIRS